MLVWRVVVGVPLGIYAALVLYMMGFVALRAPFLGLTSDSYPTGLGLVFFALVILSVALPVCLIRGSSSARETFRRSLPIIGLGSLAFLLVFFVLRANGQIPDLTSDDRAGALGTALGLAILLPPIVCPVLYYWVVPSRNRPRRAKETEPPVHQIVE